MLPLNSCVNLKTRKFTLEPDNIFPSPDNPVVIAAPQDCLAPKAKRLQPGDHVHLHSGESIESGESCESVRLFTSSGSQNHGSVRCESRESGSESQSGSLLRKGNGTDVVTGTGLGEGIIGGGEMGMGNVDDGRGRDDIPQGKGQGDDGMIMQADTKDDVKMNDGSRFRDYFGRSSSDLGQGLVEGLVRVGEDGARRVFGDGTNADYHGQAGWTPERGGDGGDGGDGGNHCERGQAEQIIGEPTCERWKRSSQELSGANHYVCACAFQPHLNACNDKHNMRIQTCVLGMNAPYEFTYNYTHAHAHAHAHALPVCLKYLP